VCQDWCLVGAITEQGKTLDQIRSIPYRDAFLIRDLLTSSTTFLSGEPKSGKTLLAVGMVIALLNADAHFLELPIYRRVDRVVFGLTDDGAEEELKARFEGAVPPRSVIVFPIRGTSRSGYWEGVRDDLAQSNAGLFVLDNVLGALGEGQDISSSVVAQSVAETLRLIASAGVPVLAVTHSPKGAGEGLTVASSVIGGRAIAAAGRGVISLRDSSAKGKRIFTRINRAHEDLELKVDVVQAGPESDVPVWCLVHRKVKGEVRERPAAKRSKEMGDAMAGLAGHLVHDQPEGLTSFRAVVTSGIHEGFGVSKSAVIRRLKGYIHWDGSRWVAGPGP
jgi:hypothetical protein